MMSVMYVFTTRLPPYLQKVNLWILVQMCFCDVKMIRGFLLKMVKMIRHKQAIL